MSGYFGGCQIGQLLDLDAKARMSSVGYEQPVGMRYDLPIRHS